MILFVVLLIVGYLGFNDSFQMFDIRDEHHEYIKAISRNQDLSRIFSLIELKSDPVKEGYRFTWLRTFHHPVVITVTIDDQQGRLSLQESSGAGGYDFGELIADKNISLTNEEINRLRKTIHDNPFWNEDISRDFGFDGAVWVIEVKRPDAYYRDSQWSPQAGSIRNIGMCLLELSGYEIAPNEIY